MFRFQIDNDSHWCYFIGEKDKTQLQHRPVALASFQAIKSQFEQLFGTDYVRTRPVISVLHHIDGPESFRENGIIVLSADISCGLQFAYQFSHELCHCMVPKTVPQRFRWFEETLCQLASIYFIKAIYRAENLPRELEFYRDYVSWYFNSLCKDTPRITGTAGAFIQHYQVRLESEPYLRDTNRAIALVLLPMFELYPSLWRIVTRLHLLDPAEDLLPNLRRICRDLCLDPLPVDELMRLLGQ